ncbi:hypothetical protein IM543_11565 [Massilia sp. UMI-21]|nr:hypothetical protein IM543_11565 [Massilia sp. UMI-21]
MRLLARPALAATLIATLISTLGAAPRASADTPVYLYKSFSGNVNFAGTQVTIRDRASNASPCAVSADNVTQSASLSLPTDATVVSAHLYWAGSGATDSSVIMNGRAVTGDAGRSYTSATIGGGFDYFSVAADVTAQVRDKGAGTYRFSGLQVATGNPWCSRSAVLGGFALVVVYSHRDEIYRTLNLYEGFRALLNSEQRLVMSNFEVPPNVTPSAVGRFGHLVWEGDSDIAQGGESLSFHNVALNQSVYAPSGNNFNSRSSVNADLYSKGIDYDTYSLTGWPAGLSSVAAVFRTGGDLVLLNTAVLAVPSSPAADLSVALVRNNELRANSSASYTVTVTNNGPGVEPGPTRLTLSLPSGMSYASFSGANWNCSGSGGSATCTYTGAINKGGKAVLTLNAVVASGASGSKTTTVTVTGNNDPATANDQASDTATVGGAGGISYEYTERACGAGELVAPGPGPGICPLFAGPVVAGSTATIFLTTVDGANKAKALSSSQSSTVKLDLALGCVNPSSYADDKIKAYYGGVELALCGNDATVGTSTSAWKRVNANFAPNEISMKLSFRYGDVGAIKLYARTDTGIVDFVQFVSVPESFRLTIRNAQGQANPGAVGLAQQGFVRAGERFTIGVEALSAVYTNAAGVRDRHAVPNFGREEGGRRALLVNSIARIDTPAGTATAAENPPLEGSYPDRGAYTGNAFYWSDIGSFALTVGLEDGLYLGASAGAVGTQTVGRVYPAYFSTYTGPGPEDGDLAGFPCLTRMNCPIVGLAKVKGAVYANQPFDVTVAAHDESGRRLANFDHTRFPSLVPALTLAAVDAPGTGAPFAGRITPGLAAAVGSAANASTRSMKFGLGTPYDAGAARSAWLAPTAVYLRATAPDNRLGSPLTISTVQSDATQSEEGGVMVVNGRLSIASLIGSELLRTPVPLQAQYWNGRNWENNTAFSHASLLDAGQARFTDCRNTLLLKGAVAPDNCNTAVVKAAGAGPLALSDGAARLVLAPVGAGQSGRVRIRLVGVDWLPSTFGQVTIGAYRSPVIYVREMY